MLEWANPNMWNEQFTVDGTLIEADEPSEFLAKVRAEKWPRRDEVDFTGRSGRTENSISTTERGPGSFEKSKGSEPKLGT